MTDELQRDVGRMEAELAAMKEAMDEVRADLREIKNAFHELKGGTRTLMGVAMVVGSIISLAVNWFLGKH